MCLGHPSFPMLSTSCTAKQEAKVLRRFRDFARNRWPFGPETRATLVTSRRAGAWQVSGRRPDWAEAWRGQATLDLSCRAPGGYARPIMAVRHGGRPLHVAPAGLFLDVRTPRRGSAMQRNSGWRQAAVGRTDRAVVPGQDRERSTIAAASGRPSCARPVTTPSMSRSGRFWLILTFTSTREITSSTPTMACN